MTDHDLLRRYVRDRSEPAFAELVRRHSPWVGASATRQVRDPHLADDVTQAVFLLLATKAPSFPESTPVAPWLFGALRRDGPAGASVGIIRPDGRTRTALGE